MFVRGEKQRSRTRQAQVYDVRKVCLPFGVFGENIMERMGKKTYENYEESFPTALFFCLVLTCNENLIKS